MKTMLWVVGAMLATSPVQALPHKSGKASVEDPNRMICRTESATGSRLLIQKRCLTAQQWADQKLFDRSVVERAQGGGWRSDPRQDGRDATGRRQW